MPTIYWASDSTVQYNDINTYPQTGIGQVMHLYLKPDVIVMNHAKNGRSTKQFLAEGRLVPICEQISEGDFLFIQFGHNDAKESDPNRFTDPDTEYRANLEMFVNAAREKGAFPVLITPLMRRWFVSDTELDANCHREYSRVMKEVAAGLCVPLIDLCSVSRQMILDAGKDETKEWFMHLPAGVYPYHMNGLEDNTHLKYAGAVKFAGAIADGLRALGGIYAALTLDLLGERP